MIPTAQIAELRHSDMGEVPVIKIAEIKKFVIKQQNDRLSSVGKIVDYKGVIENIKEEYQNWCNLNQKI